MTSMTRLFQAMSASVFAFTILAGCAETQFPEATGKGTINTINAMPASPAVVFRIEERLLGTVGYKGTLGAQSFDDLSYNFNFEYTVLGESEPTRFATQQVDMLADNDYTLVITGSVSAPTITQLERPERVFEDTETVFEVAIAHLSPALGNVDVYIALTGTAPVLGEERAKLSFGERMPEFDLEAEAYEIIITAPDDPATVLYQSEVTTLLARVTYTIGIFDADPSITGNLSVRLISTQGLSAELPDSNFLPTLRTIHAAFGTVNLDIYRDQDFTAPIVSDLGFGMITGDIPVPAGSPFYTYTAVGNIGMIIEEQIQPVFAGSRVTAILVGMQGSDLTSIVLTDNRRPVETHAKMRLVHAAANFERLDLYLVETGTGIADVGPLIAGLTFSTSSDFAPTIPGDYDFILTLPDDKNPVATASIDLVAGDVAEVIILDTVDPVVADVVVTRF